MRPTRNAISVRNKKLAWEDGAEYLLSREEKDDGSLDREVEKKETLENRMGG